MTIKMYRFASKVIQPLFVEDILAVEHNKVDNDDYDNSNNGDDYDDNDDHFK